MVKTKVIVVIGAPGVGKGTQCKLIAQQTGMIHLSTGDLCRNAVRLQTPLGWRVGEYLNRRDLVPDELMIEVTTERLKEDDAKEHGVLLDGYPRTLKQVRALVNDPNVEIDRCILMQASDETCTERILGRRLDPETGDSYNTFFPECGCDNQEVSQRLIRRDNDTSEDIIQIRLKFYHLNLGQILPYFKGKIFPINGGQSIQQVNHDLSRALIQEVTEPRPTTRRVTRQQRQQPQQSAEQQCAICTVETADFLVTPCGHQCGCGDCLSIIFAQRNPKCPICVGPMTGLVKVFRSGIVDEDDDRDLDLNLEVANAFEDQTDGGWGAADLSAHQNMIISQFERNISDQVKVDISLSDEVIPNRPVNVAVSINPPDLTERVPVDICCVIDTSMSMSCDASFQDPNDETKIVSEGLTILDLVKHAVKTIIHTLTDHDRLALVTFNTESRIVFSLSEMNEGGKKQVIKILETLEPGNRTNIWAGLEAGLNALRAANEFFTDSKVTRKKNIFLLTDGRPVISPPQGEPMALKEYLDTHPTLKCQIQTFGFGYDLKSQLLLDLAVHGNGSYSFIPDAKILGTCFVNAVANACSTLSQNCRVHLTPAGGASFAGPVEGLIPFEQTSWGLVVHFGPLYYGQVRDIIVPMKLSGEDQEEAYLKVIVEYESVQDEESYQVVAEGSDRGAENWAVTANLRNQAVKTCYQVINQCAKGRGGDGVDLMRALVGQTTAAAVVNPQIGGFLQDLSGRMSKAISTVERFNRWGQHYLRAITRSHQLQICTNFMDPGLQQYGGKMFSDLKERGGEIFLTLPLVKMQPRPVTDPTQPARRVARPSYHSSSRRPASPVRNVTYYGGSGGGCFAASSKVTLGLYGAEITIDQLKPSQSVRVMEADGQASTAKVVYLVRLAVDNIKLVKLISGLMVTPTHPIQDFGRWVRPIDLIDKYESTVMVSSNDKFVYNVVLDRPRVKLMVNDVPCATFGHQIREIWHPFYATDQVINVISELADQNGIVTVDRSLKSYI